MAFRTTCTPAGATLWALTTSTRIGRWAKAARDRRRPPSRRRRRRRRGRGGGSKGEVPKPVSETNRFFLKRTVALSQFASYCPWRDGHAPRSSERPAGDRDAFGVAAAETWLVADGFRRSFRFASAGNRALNGAAANRVSTSSCESPTHSTCPCRVLTGRWSPEKKLKDLATELRSLGLVDLRVEDATTPLAFRRPEETVAGAVAGKEPEARIIEGIPAVLAWNRWHPELLRAFAREAGRGVSRRLAWLADIALAIDRAGGFPGGIVGRVSSGDLCLDREAADFGTMGRGGTLGIATAEVADLETLEDRLPREPRIFSASGEVACRTEERGGDVLAVAREEVNHGRRFAQCRKDSRFAG